MNTADLPSGKKFKSRFIQPGLAGYPQQYGNVLITKESLDKFVNTLEGKPVIINHQEVTTKNVADIEVGRVHNVWFNDEDGWYWCDGVLTSQNAIDLINDGYSVSCSYNVSDFTDKGGTVNNIKYDMEFLDGVFTHLAIVNNPRYEDAEITVINSKGDDMQIDNDKWITVHPGGNEDAKGVHVLVKEGETPEDAIERLDGKESKSTPKEENRHEQIRTLEDKAYKEFKTIYENYINKDDVSISQFDKAVDKFNKKYKSEFEKLESDRFVSFEELAKRENKTQDKSDKGEDRGTKRQNKIKEYKKQLHDKYKSLKTSEEKKAYLDYVNKETEKYSEDVNYKTAVEWLKEVDKSDIFGKQSDNSLTNTIVSALAEVIAENCIKE